MYNINVSDNRLYSIINILLSSSVSTLDFLSRKLNVSSKTIKNNIRDLNNIFGNSALIRIKNNNCILYIFNYESFNIKCREIGEFNYIYNSPINRMNYIMTKLLDYKECLIDELAEEMNVARTTLVSDLSRLRENLNRYNLKIVGKPNKGLYIEGNEIDIRLYIIDNIDFLNYNILDKTIVKLIEGESIKRELTFESKKTFTRYFAVSFIRYKNGYDIGELDLKIKDLENTKAYRIVHSICNVIHRELDIRIPKSEELFISLSLIGTRISKHYDRVNKNSINLAIEIIEYINKEFNVSIIPNKLFEDFIYHIDLMLNRIKYNMKLDNCLLDYIGEKYPLAYKISQVVGKCILSKFGYEVSDNELGFLAIYFELFIRESNVTNIIKVAIVMDVGLIISRLIVNNLRKIFNHSVDIDILYHELDLIIDNKYDFIITTMNLNKVINIPIIRLEEALDINELKKKIDNSRYHKILDKPLIRGIEFITLNVLLKENFVLLKNDNDYLGCLEYMINHIFNQGLIDNQFKTRILNKEKTSPMIFKNIALPHALNYGNDKPVLVLGVCENPIIFNGNDLRLIFLLAIPDNQDFKDDILLRIYDEIMGIASDIKQIEDISRLRNYEELLMYFVQNK